MSVNGEVVDVVVCTTCYMSGRKFARRLPVGSEQFLSPMRTELEKERAAFEEKLAQAAVGKEAADARALAAEEKVAQLLAELDRMKRQSISQVPAES